jgi:hypothetical protein
METELNKDPVSSKDNKQVKKNTLPHAPVPVLFFPAFRNYLYTRASSRRSVLSLSQIIGMND